MNVSKSSSSSFFVLDSFRDFRGRGRGRERGRGEEGRSTGSRTRDEHENEVVFVVFAPQNQPLSR
jgi:hypothetical protein